jgi:hypothetical protein
MTAEALPANGRSMAEFLLDNFYVYVEVLPACRYSMLPETMDADS